MNVNDVKPDPSTFDLWTLHAPALATNEAFTPDTPDCGGCVGPPPTIAGGSVNPSVLWPPNHKVVGVTVAYTAADNCDPAPNCSLIVTSNEGTSADWQIIDAHHVLLRAERSGGGNGRTYMIKITCTDSSGNTSSSIVTVSVPHDQR